MQRPFDPGLRPLDFLRAAQSQLQVADFELLCVILWRCWFRRNRAVHGQLLLPAGEVLAWSSSFLAEYQVGGTRPPSTSSLTRSVSRWVPPPTGSFKLNVDASLAVHAGVIRLGLVIRDSLERVRAAGSVSVAALFSPILAEATAVLHGIRLAIDTGFSPLLVESDALGVINVLRTGSIPCSDLGLIISDIFQFCRCSIVFSCSFIPRIANRVADSLAKAAISSVEDRFWFEVCPFIVELLVQDDSPG
ncbi:hypothetical protein ACOSQ3_021671 [Xanthoceras sorbifolium]